MTFASLPSEEDQEEEEDENELEKLRNLNMTSKKRLANKIDKLFIMLYEDLNFLIEWEVEEKKKLDEQSPNAYSYSGLIWVHRGMLAERMNRKRLAEKAY